MNETINSTDTLSTTSNSIETLEEIVRKYKRREQYIHELVRNTRYERKKAERFLQNIYQSLQERHQQISTYANTINKPNLKKPIKFFISFDNKTKKKIHHNSCNRYNTSKIKSSLKKSILKERDTKSISAILSDNTIQSNHSTVSSNHRVRFNIPEKSHDLLKSYRSNAIYDQLSDLAHRCEDLLLGLETNRKQIITTTYDDSKTPLVYPESNQLVENKQTYEYRPSHTHSYLKHIKPLYKEQECNHEINHKCQQIHSSTYSNRISNDTYEKNLIRLPLSNENKIKQTSKKFNEPLSNINNQLEKTLLNPTHLRNTLGNEILQLRLRQNNLIHGRTHINDSLLMNDI